MTDIDIIVIEIGEDIGRARLYKTTGGSVEILGMHGHRCGYVPMHDTLYADNRDGDPYNACGAIFHHSGGSHKCDVCGGGPWFYRLPELPSHAQGPVRVELDNGTGLLAW